MGCQFRDQDCDLPLAVILSLALLTCSLWWKSNATLWGAPWRGPCSKELGTDSLQPPASKEPRPWVQQPTRNCLPMITWVGLESSPSPAEPWVWLTSWLQPHGRTWARGPNYTVSEFLANGNCEINVVESPLSVIIPPTPTHLYRDIYLSTKVRFPACKHFE